MGNLLITQNKRNESSVRHLFCCKRLSLQVNSQYKDFRITEYYHHRKIHKVMYNISSNMTRIDHHLCFDLYRYFFRVAPCPPYAKVPPLNVSTVWLFGIVLGHNCIRVQSPIWAERVRPWSLVY